MKRLQVEDPAMFRYLFLVAYSLGIFTHIHAYLTMILITLTFLLFFTFIFHTFQRNFKTYFLTTMTLISMFDRLYLNNTRYNRISKTHAFLGKQAL